MKKIIEFIKKHKTDALGAVVVGLAAVFLFSTAMAAAGQDDLRNDVIRLHILAADDSAAEQHLKLQVRDGIWEFVRDLTADARNMSQARDIISQNIERIEDEAWFLLQELGSDHIVTARLTRGLPFPAMTYGTVFLPQGQYEALQIIIGNGGGENWWCIMFPPMCLMDITRGQVLKQDSDEIVLRPTLRIASIFKR